MKALSTRNSPKLCNLCKGLFKALIQKQSRAEEGFCRDDVGYKLCREIGTDPELELHRHLSHLSVVSTQPSLQPRSGTDSRLE